MRQDSMDNAYTSSEPEKESKFFIKEWNKQFVAPFVAPSETKATVGKNNPTWKFQEDKTLKEVEEYLASTYNAHYTSEQSKTQTLDLIESIGDAEPFSRYNAIKYLSRFGRKNGKSKLDLLKAIHYCILLYHFSGLHENTNNEYKTF